ncbi:cell division protein ZapB [Treponema brennaborense]|uniref:Cell division protein ZapB n=1 Tax=Treponema brennaborense (strain DSM 12168 / CIP 105900 / DD5/3) TaxID=906968 RepID=F4LJH8_TREBD|nr:cell division protein ZapB [Treponema brennaborense]AEE16373.1 hypothetical protein Trebr_0937 [Treponema brennaborense DSM 12168]
MISLDQIRVLEQKVESIVAKLGLLVTENAELKQKCAQLEQSGKEAAAALSAYEQDQSKIEQGILHALDRLNTVENSVLQAAGQLQSPQQQTAPAEHTTAQPSVFAQETDTSAPQAVPETTTVSPVQTYGAADVPAAQDDIIEEKEDSLFNGTPAEQNNGQFDIF